MQHAYTTACHDNAEFAQLLLARGGHGQKATTAKGCTPQSAAALGHVASQGDERIPGRYETTANGSKPRIPGSRAARIGHSIGAPTHSTLRTSRQCCKKKRQEGTLTVSKKFPAFKGARCNNRRVGRCHRPVGPAISDARIWRPEIR